MQHIISRLFIFLLFVSTANAQNLPPSSSDSTESNPSFGAKIGLFGSGGMYRGFRQKEPICFDCTPRAYQTATFTNALATFGMVAEIGKAQKHLGIRGALGLAYQQIKWDYELEFRPRGLPLQQHTVHLRANRLLLDLNFKLRYSTLGRHPLILQMGFFANGFLTRGSKSYSTSPNRSAFFSQLLGPPMGVTAGLSHQLKAKGIVLEPFAELRYSLAMVMRDPDFTSGSLQIGLIAWMPK